MRSSTGAYFVGLDHVRALAAWLVFVWHFTHAGNGFPVPFGQTPVLPPLAWPDEGHTGVALFMTLSGYLFAKLLDGRELHYGRFLWNRAVRLLPLLIVVLVAVGVRRHLHGHPPWPYLRGLATGLVLPRLPNGGWSVTVELHFYLLLPVLLWCLRRWTWAPLALVVGAVLLRSVLYAAEGEIQSLAYWTLVGRFDQFVLGMAAARGRHLLSGRHLAMAAVAAAFCVFWWWYDGAGGFHGMPSYPSPSPVWLVLPTVEGACYAVGIAWYDTSFRHADVGPSWLIGRVGAYSYGIYLLHFFFVFAAARFIHEHVVDLSRFPVACLAATAVFAATVPLAWAAFLCVERPFLRLRVRYASAMPADADDGR